MAVIAGNPFVMSDAIMKFGADEYQSLISGVVFVPTANLKTFAGIGGDTYTLAGKSSWVCNVDYAQDWETATSLARYLFEHEGESLAVTFEPIEGGVSFTATIVVVAGSIGASADNVATSSVSLGVSGKPVLVPGV
ncbi:MAG: hypothetical protein ACOH10_13770 [Rhodoglobus sp.]